MAEDGLPPWVQYLAAQIAEMRTELGGRIDKLVTRDAFRDEQARVNTELQRLGREIGEQQADLKAEASARASERLDSAKQQAEDAKKRQSLERNKNWMWLGIILTPFVGAFVTWLISGGLLR